MTVRFTRSAFKHGIDGADALHAMLNFTYRVEEFDEPRISAGDRPDLFIGPARDSLRLLEVFAVVVPPDDILIFHVMIARPKLLRIAEGASHD